MKKIPAKKINVKKVIQKEEPTEEVLSVPAENPVYIRLEYDESLESKRDLLSSEMSFLNILRAIKRYNALREEELRIKSEMYKMIRELDASIKKTKASFPFLKIPERIRRQEIVKKEIVKEAKPIRDEIYDEDLESQLRSIQERLRSIGR